MLEDNVYICKRCGSKNFHVIRDSEDNDPQAAWCWECGTKVDIDSLRAAEEQGIQK